MADFLQNIFGNKTPLPPTQGSVPEDWLGRRLENLKGATWGAVSSIGKGLWEGGKVVAINYVHELTHPLEAIGLAPSTQDPNHKLALEGLFPYQDRLNQRQFEKGKPTNLEDEVVDKVAASATALLMDFGGGQAIKQLLTGNKETILPTGETEVQEMGSYEAGENATMAVLSALPVVGAVGRVFGKGAKVGANLAKATKDANRLKTMADVRDLNNSVNNKLPSSQLVEGKTGEVKPLARGPIPISQLLETQDFKDIYTEVTASDIYKFVVDEAVELGENPAKHELVMKALDGGALTPERWEYWQNRLGTTRLDLSKGLSLAFDQTSQYLGQTLKVLSDVDAIREVELLDQVLRGNTKARAQHRALKEKLKAANGDLSLDRLRRSWENLHGEGTGAQMFEWILDSSREGTRRMTGAMVSGWATWVRNARVQGLNTFLNLYESAMDGVVRSLHLPPRVAFEDLLGNWMGLVDSLPGGQRGWLERISGGEGTYSTINKILDEVPSIAKDLGDSNMAELGRDTLTDMFKFKELPKGLGGIVDLGIDVMNIPNRIQEGWFKKTAFSQRLIGNLKTYGYSLDEGLKILERGAGPNGEFVKEFGQVKVALAESLDHANKTTFSRNPTHWLGQGIMSAYSKLPILKVLGPTFPRFYLNTARFLWEHDPTILSGLFSPRYRDLLRASTNPTLTVAPLEKGGFGLFEGGKKWGKQTFSSKKAAQDALAELNPMMSKEASRMMAQGISGLTMMGLGYLMRQSPELAGGKYYEFKRADGTTLDVRSDEPFTHYAAIGELFNSIINNKPFNLTPSELGDLLTGQRRLSEVPILNITDILRSASKSLEQNDWDIFRKEVVDKPVGQTLAAFFRGLDGWIKAGYSVVGQGDHPNLDPKDMQGQNLTGPLRELTEHLGVDSQLVTKTNMFTGKPDSVEQPVRRHLMGVNVRTKTPLEEELLKVGLGEYDLMPDFKTPEANNLMRQKVGEVLSIQTKSGLTINQLLAQQLKGMEGLKPEIRAAQFKSQFKGIVDELLEKAMEEKPLYFVKYKVENLKEEGLPNSVQKDLLKQTVPNLPIR